MTESLNFIPYPETSLPVNPNPNPPGLDLRVLVEGMGFSRNAFGYFHPMGIELTGDLPACGVKVNGNSLFVGNESTASLADKIAFAFSFRGTISHSSLEWFPNNF